MACFDARIAKSNNKETHMDRRVVKIKKERPMLFFIESFLWQRAWRYETRVALIQTAITLDPLTPATAWGWSGNTLEYRWRRDEGKLSLTSYDSSRDKSYSTKHNRRSREKKKKKIQQNEKYFSKKKDDIFKITSEKFN